MRNSMDDLSHQAALLAANGRRMQRTYNHSKPMSLAVDSFISRARFFERAIGITLKVVVRFPVTAYLPSLA